jgi:TolB-like protein
MTRTPTTILACLLLLGCAEVPAAPAPPHAMVRTPLLTAEVPVGGWLIGFNATLRNEAGDVLPGHLLHHVNIMVPDRVDVFRPIMQRLMAAGEETEAIDLPWPLGIPVPEGRELLVYAMLHNPDDVDHGHVWLDMSIRYTERRRRAVHPFFIDVSPPPGPASWDLPPGRSERSWEGTPAVAGRILGVGGHLHRFGTELVLEDVTAGRVITRLRPDVGPDGSIRRVEIRRFFWRFGVPLRTDRVYRITAVYENPTTDTIPGGAMGAIGGAVLPRGRAWPRPDPSNPLFIRDLDGLINFDAHIHFHLGEVSTHHGDIYGEGVNLAARLQASAEADQVLVSEDVYRHVRPNPAFRFEAAGPLTLKGVPGPVQAFVVERADGTSRGRQPTVPPARPMNRLIVTPFRILRPDPETEFLAFSLADAVSFSLSNLGSIIVRSSHVAGTSPAHAMVDPREIARQSDVDLVVTGTLLRVGERLQVTAELSDGGDGTRLGSFRTQAGLGDLFELQEELSGRIVDALALPLTAGERRRMRQDVPATSRAYELYLRANELSHRGVDWAGARDLYQAALAEDPGYAPAWAQLARCHRLMAKYDTMASRPANFADAEAALHRALELNPELDLAHSYSALLETELGRAGDAMERLLARLDVRPRNVDVLAGLVHVLRYCGLLDESFQADRSARALDPAARTSIAYTLFMRGDFEASTEAGTEIDIYVRAMAQLVLGRDQEARASIQKLDALASPFHRFAEPLQLLMAGRHDAVVDSGMTVYRTSRTRKAAISSPASWPGWGRGPGPSRCWRISRPATRPCPRPAWTRGSPAWTGPRSTSGSSEASSRAGPRPGSTIAPRPWPSRAETPGAALAVRRRPG